MRLGAGTTSDDPTIAGDYSTTAGYDAATTTDYHSTTSNDSTATTTRNDAVLISIAYYLPAHSPTSVAERW